MINYVPVSRCMNPNQPRSQVPCALLQHLVK